MNRRTSSVLAFGSSVVAAALAATVMASNAYADDITIDNTHFTSTKTRAEVKADLMSHLDQVNGNEYARQQFDSSGYAGAQNPSGYTRAQARAEYIASRDQVQAMNSEDSGSATLAQVHVQTPSGFMTAKSSH